MIALPAQIPRWETELAALASGDRIRREMFQWMSRRDRLRMETLAKSISESEDEPS
jgi:hypothetical protein